MVRSVLLVVLAWVLAHNILYTYIAPFLVQAGLKYRVDLVLLIFGVASVVGVWVVGMWIDRRLRCSFLLVCPVLLWRPLCWALAATNLCLCIELHSPFAKLVYTGGQSTNPTVV